MESRRERVLGGSGSGTGLDAVPGVALGLDPPPRLARAVATVVLVVLVGLFVAAFLLDIPQSVRCHFALVPERGGDPIQAPRAGRLVEVRAADGLEVQAGDVLYRIRSDEVRDLIAERAVLRRKLPVLRARRAAAVAEAAARRQAAAQEAVRLEQTATRLRAQLGEDRRLHALAAAREAREVETLATQAEKLAEELQLYRKAVAERRELLKTLEGLSKKGVASLDTIRRERVKLVLAEVAAQGTATRRALAVAKRAEQEARAQETAAERGQALQDRAAALARTGSELVQARHQAVAAGKKDEAAVALRAAEVQQAEVRLGALESELVETEGDLVLVRAPFAGTVYGLGPRRKGAEVQRGQVLCTVAPSGPDAALVAELVVPARSAGEVQAGQKVALLFDAFPFTRYGVGRARLLRVSPGAVDADGRFRAVAALSRQVVRVRGEDRPLRAGMGGEARVVTGSLPLVSYVLEPLRELAESVSPSTE